MKILGICGSLRKVSYNAMALRAAQRLAPAAGVEIDIADIAAIPFYNDDVRVAGEPQPVADLKARVRAADAVLLAMPEYNFSVPGVLKNVLDWMSRPPEPPFDGKVVGILGASQGPVGTARGQYDLRKIMVYMNAFTVNKPEVFIANAQAKFDAGGELTDEATKKFIGELLLAMKALKTRLG